jgi:choline transport protein
LNNPDYVLERWHTTLVMWAITLLSYAQQIWAIKFFPILSVFTGALHVIMFLVIFIVLLVLGRNADANFVFTGFVNETGWESNGVAWFIGLLPCIWCFVGMTSCTKSTRSSSP